jgi:hypothetical protein
LADGARACCALGGADMFSGFQTAPHGQKTGRFTLHSTPGERSENRRKPE